MPPKKTCSGQEIGLAIFFSIQGNSRKCLENIVLRRHANV